MGDVDSCTIKGLHSRMDCAQDIEETYAEFQYAANRYVAKRTGIEERKAFGHLMGVIMLPSNAIRYISDRNIQDLHEAQGGGDREPTIYFQSAINMIHSLHDEINWIREIVGLPPWRGPGFNRDSMEFYYIHDRIRQQVDAAGQLCSTFVDWYKTRTKEKP